MQPHSMTSPLQFFATCPKGIESLLADELRAFDADNDADDDSFHAAPAGYLQDMRYNPEVLATQSDHEDLRQTQLSSALTSLDARSRDIIQRRWLDEKKPTLHELADEYGISAERIRQIESKALDVMKDALEA